MEKHENNTSMAIGLLVCSIVSWYLGYVTGKDEAKTEEMINKALNKKEEE